MTYLAVPFLNWAIDGNRITFGAYSQGANDYQYRYRYNNESTYYYVSKVPHTDYAIMDRDIKVHHIKINGRRSKLFFICCYRSKG